LIATNPQYAKNYSYSAIMKNIFIDSRRRNSIEKMMIIMVMIICPSGLGGTGNFLGREH
jgi:hypothetical protein